MRMSLALAAVLAGSPGSAAAQPGATPTAPTPEPPPANTTAPEPGGADYVPAPRPKDIVITTPGERSKQNLVLLGSLAGAGALFGGIGVAFLLDANAASGKVAATAPTGLPWTPALQKQYDHAQSSSVAAEVTLSVGGALLVGAVIGLFLTVPKDQTTVIHSQGVTAGVAPTRGGAVVAGTWRF